MLQRAHFPVRGQLDGPALPPDAPATGTIGDIVTPPGASDAEGADDVVAAEVVGVAVVVSDSERDRPQAVIVRTTNTGARYFVIE